MKSMPDEIAPSGEPQARSRATSAIIAALRAPPSAKAVLLALLQLKGGSASISLPGGRTLMFGDGDGPQVDFTIKD